MGRHSTRYPAEVRERAVRMQEESESFSVDAGDFVQFVSIRQPRAPLLRVGKAMEPSDASDGTRPPSMILMKTRAGNSIGPASGKRVGHLKELDDTEIHRFRERHFHRQAAHRGRLSDPTRPAGYREGRKAPSPPTGTRSGFGHLATVKPLGQSSHAHERANGLPDPLGRGLDLTISQMGVAHRHAHVGMAEHP